METISRKDLTTAWLAGFIDADGCISFYQNYNNRRTKRSSWLRPYVQVTNTSTITYEHLVAVYKELGIAVHVSMKPNGSETRKPVYVFTTIGLKRTKPLLALLEPYLVTKQREAQLLLEFIDLREAVLGKGIHSPREEAILAEMKEIKASRNIVKNPQRLYARLH